MSVTSSRFPKSSPEVISPMSSKRKACDCPSKDKLSNSSRRKFLRNNNLLKTKSSEKRRFKLQKHNHKDRSKYGNRYTDSQKLMKREKRKRTKHKVELDEATRLQRRTKYLLIKMKLEQNLIDAYSAEGWKGQSREKIKPDKELQRAKKQILKCKIGIRDAILQLDLLGSVGCIDDALIAPDGSVHHEHIICAKCKLREAFPDNDIILCDGTCNCAFHQKCLDPPLSTEDMPAEDEGWFCKFCKSKMEILEAANAHLGTHFSLDSSWEDIFKEALVPENGDSLLCPDQEWPSDDSEDSDYNPEKLGVCHTTSSSGSSDSDDSGSTYSSRSLQDELYSTYGRFLKRNNGSQDKCSEFISGESSGEGADFEVSCRPRPRPVVDYVKLNDELFGRNALANEQNSEDEDWHPVKKKRSGNDCDAASTLMTLCKGEESCYEKGTAEVGKRSSSKRPIYRIPASAVEELRHVFTENELPSRAIREDLSKQLGIEYEKVNKWFKNARYLALKARKAKRVKSGGVLEESLIEIGKDKTYDEMLLRDLTSAPKNLRRCHWRKATYLGSNPLMKRKHPRPFHQSFINTKTDVEDDVSLKLLREKAKKGKNKLNSKSRSRMLEAEGAMERLCKMKDSVEKLQQILLGLPNGRSRKSNVHTSSKSSIIYVPVAELKKGDN